MPRIGARPALDESLRTARAGIPDASTLAQRDQFRQRLAVGAQATQQRATSRIAASLGAGSPIAQQLGAFGSQNAAANAAASIADFEFQSAQNRQDVELARRSQILQATGMLAQYRVARSQSSGGLLAGATDLLSGGVGILAGGLGLAFGLQQFGRGRPGTQVTNPLGDGLAGPMGEFGLPLDYSPGSSLGGFAPLEGFAPGPALISADLPSLV